MTQSNDLLYTSNGFGTGDNPVYNTAGLGFTSPAHIRDVVMAAALHPRTVEAPTDTPVRLI